MARPYYTIRFNSNTEINPKFSKVIFQNGSISKLYPKQGIPVFHVPELSSFVLPSTLYTKGSDASNENDEEPPPEVNFFFLNTKYSLISLLKELEYSDDEEEQKAKKSLKQTKK